MKLSVHLVAWNGEKYIPYLFESLRNQTFSDWFLLVIDNHSTDGTAEAIKKELENFPIQHRLIENKENNGFAGGHSQAWRETDSEYFLLLNQDMYLQPDCLEKMVKFLDAHEQVAAVSPRLMKWNFARVEEDLQQSFSKQIDALGLKIFRNRRVVEQYTQEEWDRDAILGGEKKLLALQDSASALGGGRIEYALEVFGVSGAFPMFRRSVIKKISFDGNQFLDESYHSYKEDVDLAYRLQSVGYQSYILLDTVAYHDRAGAGPKETSDRAALKNRKTQSSWVRFHSYKNHLATLYKNEYWQNFLLDFSWILWYELKKFVFLLIFERKILVGLKEIWVNRKELRKKRDFIKSQRRVGYQEIRKWWI